MVTPRETGPAIAQACLDEHRALLLDEAEIKDPDPANVARDQGPALVRPWRDSINEGSGVEGPHEGATAGRVDR